MREQLFVLVVEKHPFGASSLRYHNIAVMGQGLLSVLPMKISTPCQKGPVFDALIFTFSRLGFDILYSWKFGGELNLAVWWTA